MWDTLTLPFSGNFSLRKIAYSLCAVLITAFLWTLFHSPLAFAADGTWQNGAISYNGDNYQTDSATYPNISGSEQYSATSGDKRKLIYFSANDDTTKEFKAKYVEYTVTQPGNILSNGTAPRDITVDAKPGAKKKTQCDIVGVGWIICMTSKYIAEGMDRIFGIIADFLVVKPISTDQNSGLYKAWSVALSIANLLFVVAFLFMIYSYTTSYGMSNYNLKKMIPKLIIASILVNVSFYICAIAVDISNILGFSIQEALISIRKSLPDPTSQISWSNMTVFIASGGTIAAGVPIGIIGGSAALGAAGGVSGLMFILFPILVAGALAVLVALIILAARQALIVVLIVAAPLAFVAYLLPNTEKWFEKWRELFTTMLLVFPLFSLLFGGSQLASFIVIQNTNQISVVIFAMFIQVAPLVATPFLVKFSGSLLGRLAGMIDNPRKGLVDRARNFAQPRADIRKAAMISKGAQGRGFSPSRMAYKRDMSRRNREGLKAMYDNEADAAWHHDDRYHAIHKRNKTSDVIKKVGESNGDAHFEKFRASNATLNKYVTTQRLNDDVIKNYQAREEADWQEAKSRAMTDENQRFAAVADQSRALYQESRIIQDNSTIAESLKKTEWATDLDNNDALLARAGGIGGSTGAIKIKAAAISENINTSAETVKAIKVASDIQTGDVGAMRAKFVEAVDSGDIASMRAHADMLAESANIGMDTLRQVIGEKEAVLRTQENNLEVFRHHINSNQTINAQAEDIAVWSRDNNNGYRFINEVGNDGNTWKNLTATQIATSKASTQDLALNARKSDGSFALTPEMAADIVKSQAWINIKDEQKPKFLARAGIADRFDVRGGRG